MDRNSILKRICSKSVSIIDFKWDSLCAPPLLSFISPQDIMYISKLVSSIKYSSKIDYKLSEIDKIMKFRGFVKLSGGTNRVCYRFLENDSIVLKIAIDDVGKKDNPREFKNQFYLKPYVTKIFEVSPCGTVALVERVDNIKSREEFISIAGDIFDVISNWIIGKYVLDDIGTKYFMNWGVRPGFGPVLLDFPYMYELDGEKLSCNLPINNIGEICDGVIEYDDGYNKLFCPKCHTEYKAIELKKAIEDNKIIGTGKVGSKMEISIKVKGKEKIIDPTKTARKITKLEMIHESKPPIGSLMVVADPLSRDINIPKEVIDSVNNINPLVESPKIKKKVINISFGPKDVEVVDKNLDVEKNESYKARIINNLSSEESEDLMEITAEELDENESVEEEESEDLMEITAEELEENESVEESEEDDSYEIPVEELEENESVEESEEDDSYEIPVGAMPPSSRLNVKERSTKFDPSFYEN